MDPGMLSQLLGCHDGCLSTDHVLRFFWPRDRTSTRAHVCCYASGAQMCYSLINQSLPLLLSLALEQQEKPVLQHSKEFWYGFV